MFNLWKQSKLTIEFILNLNYLKIHFFQLICWAKSTNACNVFCHPAEVSINLSQVLAECGQSFHMEFYRTCHLYHHGKLFYFSLNAETDRVRKGLRAWDERDDCERYRNSDDWTEGKVRQVYLFLYLFFAPRSTHWWQVNFEPEEIFQRFPQSSMPLPTWQGSQF